MNIDNLQPTQANKKSKQISGLSAQKSNLILPLSELQQVYPQFQICTRSTFYPYNHQYDDFGWGCAWRAILTVLSTFNIQYDFKELVQKYKNKEKLLDIYFKNKSIGNNANQEIKNIKWAPSQNENCWAEPFISSLICKDHKLQTKLILVNGYPQAYAPQFVFQQVLSFKNFWEFIKSNIPKSPIMIDDGQLALCIVGYREGIQQQKHIILADPHITSNNTSELKYTGIYQVILNKNGEQIKNDVKSDIQYPFCSSIKIYFNEKKWMAMAVISPD